MMVCVKYCLTTVQVGPLKGSCRSLRARAMEVMPPMPTTARTTYNQNRLFLTCFFELGRREEDGEPFGESAWPLRCGEAASAGLRSGALSEGAVSGLVVEGSSTVVVSVGLLRRVFRPTFVPAAFFGGCLDPHSLGIDGHHSHVAVET